MLLGSVWIIFVYVNEASSFWSVLFKIYLIYLLEAVGHLAQYLENWILRLVWDLLDGIQKKLPKITPKLFYLDRTEIIEGISPDESEQEHYITSFCEFIVRR